LLRALGEPEKAAERCQVVLKSGTKDKGALVSAYSRLLDYHHDRYDYKQVEELYRKICEMDPTNAWVRGNYADFLRKDLGKFDEAIAWARKALSIMDYGVGRRILAFCLYAKWADVTINQNKSGSQAEQYYREAFQLFPDLDYAMVWEASEPTGIALAKALVSKGIPIDVKTEDGTTALIVAFGENRVGVAKYLLSLGANPNAKNNKGMFPLFGAAYTGNEVAVRLLLQNGADPSQRFQNADAATWAERQGHTAIANLIRQYAKTAK